MATEERRVCDAGEGNAGNAGNEEGGELPNPWHGASTFHARTSLDYRLDIPI